MYKVKLYALCLVCGMASLVFGEAVTPPSIDFENEKLWGLRPQWGLDDTGWTNASSEVYWYYDGVTNSNNSSIRTYDLEAEASPYDKFTIPSGVNPRPDYMKKAEENRGLMEVLATGTLLRTLRPVEETGLQASDGLTMRDGGLYLDMLLAMKVETDPPDAQSCALAGSKLEVRLCTNVVAGVREGYRAVMVTAGGLDASGDLIYSNYVTTNVVAEDAWCRLTARVVSNACTRAGASVPCFALYIDGVPVACEKTVYDAAIGAGANAYFAGDDRYAACALFPSMQKSGGKRYADRMYAIGFEGDVRMDELGVTYDNPLAHSAATLPCCLVCTDESLEALSSVLVHGETYTTNTLTKPFNGQTIVVSPGDQLSFLMTPASNWVVQSTLKLTGNTSSDTIAAFDGLTITFADDGTGEFIDSSTVTISIGAQKTYFRVGDKNYATFSEALKAAQYTTDKRVTLTADVTLSNDPLADNGQVRVPAQKKVVLDLLGHVITGDHFDGGAAIYDQGDLTIFNSAPSNGAIRAEGGTLVEVADNDALSTQHAKAKLTLGTDDTKGFSVLGRVRCGTNALGVAQGTIAIKAGAYLNPPEASPDNFYLKDYVVDDGRFTVEKTQVTDPVTGDKGWGFVVTNAGNERVLSFVAEHGAATPSSVHVAVDGTYDLKNVSVTLQGYTFQHWLCGGVTYAADATVTVKSNMTFTAVDTLATYTIKYDTYVQSNPTDYTVERGKVSLLSPTRALWRFAGWRNADGRFVDSVGRGATFVGTEDLVCGDLDLTATWEPQALAWNNTTYGLAESNGTYAGAWPFSLPSDSSTLLDGQKVKVTSIDFAIVNPLQYPRTAEYLTVTNGAGMRVTSKPRVFGYDAATRAYIVGTNVLSNGRAKVGYAFTNLYVRVGASYGVAFTDETGLVRTNGFLRLMKPERANQRVIGCCTEAGGEPASEEYKKFCPAYEIHAHAVEEAEGD